MNCGKHSAPPRFYVVILHGHAGDSAAPEKNIQKVIILWHYAQNKVKRKTDRRLF